LELQGLEAAMGHCAGISIAPSESLPASAITCLWEERKENAKPQHSTGGNPHLQTCFAWVGLARKVLSVWGWFGRSCSGIHQHLMPPPSPTTRQPEGNTEPSGGNQQCQQDPEAKKETSRQVSPPLLIMES